MVTCNRLINSSNTDRTSLRIKTTAVDTPQDNHNQLARLFVKEVRVMPFHT